MPFRWIILLLALAAVVSAVLAFGGLGVVLTAILFVVVFRARNTRLFGTMAADAILILFVGLLFIGVPWLFVQLVLNKDPEFYNRRFCHDNLQQIMIALGDYHQAYGCFPPAYVADKSGRPMHSWRVLILPYLHRGSLYKQYSFNEPWDGPNNKKLLAARPGVYVCPSDKIASDPAATCTSYVAVVGANAAWSGEKPRTAADVAPLNRTVMLVEVADANVPWTEPRDLSLDSASTASHERTTVSSEHLPSGFFFHVPQAKVHVAMPDGDVQFLPEELFDGPKSSDLLKVGGFPQEYLDKEWSMSEGRIHWPHCIAFTVWSMSVGLLLYRAFQRRKQLAATLIEGRAGEGTTDKHG